MDHFIITSGYKVFSISKSMSETNNIVAGSRLYYHAKDLQMEPSYVMQPRDSNFILKATDVDYYCNLPYYLRGKHLMLYTFVPSAAAGPTDNGTYCISSDDTVTTHIDGGARYNHKLWDLESDHFVVDHWWGSSVYLTESRMITSDRRVIFFNHIRNIYGPLAWIIPGKRLQHRKLTHGGFGYIKSQNANTISHSFNILNTTDVVTITDSLFYSAYIKYSNSTKPNMGDVERILRGNVCDKLASQYAAVLFQVLGDPSVLTAILTPVQITTVTPNADNSYYPIGPSTFDDGKPSMRAVGPKYMDDCFHPKRGINSDASTVKGRITDVTNNNASVPPFYVQCLNDFVCMLVPDYKVGTIIPEDFDYMYEKWDRPAQRRMLDAAKHLLYECVPKVKSFMKSEGYAKVTHPRNISTLPTEHNCRLGQFIYPLNKLLKETNWYAFGKEPSDVANLVQNMAVNAKFIVPTDVSKLDGSCGAFHTSIVQAVVRRAVAPTYQSEAMRLIKAERSINGTTKFGLNYHVEDNTLSGSSQTAFRNSVICACLCYISLRISGFGRQTAWKKLGIYGGDDGGTPDVNPRVITRVFARTGLHLKATTITPGNAFPFLGRYYVDPWTTNTSIVDVPRQLRKVHLSASPNTVPNTVVLRRKAAGILVNDPDTPLVSDWAKAILRVVKAVSKEDRYEKLTRVDTSFWSNCTQPFPTPPRDVAVPLVKAMFDGIGVDLDIQHWSNFFDRAKTIEDLEPSEVISADKKFEIDCLVNGEYIQANTPAVPHQDKLRTVLKDTKTVPPKNVKHQDKPRTVLKHTKTDAPKNVRHDRVSDKSNKTNKTTATIERPKCNLVKCTRQRCRFRHE